MGRSDTFDVSDGVGTTRAFPMTHKVRGSARSPTCRVGRLLRNECAAAALEPFRPSRRKAVCRLRD
jgi:hypothetical protein